MYHESAVLSYSSLRLALLGSVLRKLLPTNIASQLTKLLVLTAELALALKSQFSTLSTDFAAQLGTQTAVLGSSITGLIFGALSLFRPPPSFFFHLARQPSCLMPMKCKVSLSLSAL